MNKKNKTKQKENLVLFKKIGKLFNIDNEKLKAEKEVNKFYNDFK
jgi:hypothetical protein